MDISKLTKGLDKEKSEIKKLTIKALTEMTAVAKDWSEMYVPYKTGRLERSIVSQVYRNKRIGVVRINSGNKASKYANFIHYGRYKLGVGSKQKASTLGVRVGRGYISRGVFGNKREYKRILKRTLKR